jgi:hypothetical protein
MRPIRSVSLSARRQQGAVLLMAMLLLALMLVLGVSAMEGGIGQEKLSANARDRSVAFENSESALRGGFDYLRKQINDGIGAPDNQAGYYYGTNVPDSGGSVAAQSDTASLDFWSAYKWKDTNSRKYSMAAPKLAKENGRFLIERYRFDDETEPASPTIYNVFFNVVTARAEGANGGLTAHQATLLTIPR